MRTHTQIYPAGYTTDKKCFQLDRVCFDLSYPRAFFVAIKDNFCNFSVSQIYLFCEFPISIQFIEVIQIDLSAPSDLRRNIFAETLEKNPLSVRQISPKTPQHNFLVRYYVYWRSRRWECAIRWSRSVAKRTNPLDLAQNTWLRPPPFRIIRCSEFDDAARQILFPKNPQ